MDRPSLSENIISFSQLSLLRRQLSGQIVVLGTGCFDILHTGHLYFLKNSRAQGDILVVGINGDNAVRNMKGSNRPIKDQGQRANLIAALRYVNYVFIYDDVVADSSILELKPDVYAIGDESVDAYPGEIAAASSVGAHIYVVQKLPSISTTLVIQSVLAGERVNS